MANTTTFPTDVALSAPSISASVVQTLLRNCVMLQAFHLFSQTKPNEVFDVGNPESTNILSGAELDPNMIQELEQDSAYFPLIKNIIENDYKRMAFRDTMPTVATNTGTAASYTITVTNGSITAVAVASGGSSYAGVAPTLIAVDALGSAGFGAVLQATTSGGAVTAVTVLNGGSNYSASGVSIVENYGYSEGEQYARPEFHYSQILNTARIYDTDVAAVRKLAKDAVKEKEGVISLAATAYKEKMALQAQVIAQDLVTGTPTSQSARLWDQQFGLLGAVDDGSNTTNYAGIDRTLAANYWWRAVVDSSAQNLSLAKLVDDANLTKGLATKGEGIDVFFVPLNLLAKYKAEEVAYTTNVNMDDKVREFGQYGFKTQMLKYGNVYVIGDTRIPQKTAIGLNMKSFIFHFLPGAKFTPSELYPQHGIPGGIKGNVFFVETQWRAICVAPNLNVKYTNLS